MRLNTQSPIPLYRQLAERLLADIDSGLYEVDGKIPSEHHLAEQFAIGRPTVRQATDLLIRQGRLERRRGSGTFVTPPAPNIDLFSLAGTTAALQNSDLDARLELLVSATRTRFSNDDFFNVQRRVVVDNQPVLLESLYFHADIFSGMDKHNLENRSLSALVKEAYFLEPTAAEQTFSVVLADKDIASTLALPEQTPLLRVHRTLHFGEYQSAMQAHITCRTDRFEFSQSLYPAQVH